MDDLYTTASNLCVKVLPTVIPRLEVYAQSFGMPIRGSGAAGGRRWTRATRDIVSGKPVSAAGQPPLTASARLVCQAIVVKDRLFVSRQQLAVGLDRRC